MALNYLLWQLGWNKKNTSTQSRNPDSLILKGSASITKRLPQHRTLHTEGGGGKRERKHVFEKQHPACFFCSWTGANTVPSGFYLFMWKRGRRRFPELQYIFHNRSNKNNLCFPFLKQRGVWFSTHTFNSIDFNDIPPYIGVWAESGTKPSICQWKQWIQIFGVI